jgi:hypothetical protein
MKMKFLVAIFALQVTSTFAIEWNEVLPEIRQKSQAISTNMIAADNKRVEDTGFYANYPRKVDSQESKEYRRKAQEYIKELETLADTLVHQDVLELVQNLSRFPLGIQVEEDNSMTEPMTIFYKFTGLGLAGNVLNSLRDEPHPNYSRYTNPEKVIIARHIMKFASDQAKIGSQFFQPCYAPDGYLFKEAVSISQLANTLIKNFSK